MGTAAGKQPQLLLIPARSLAATKAESQARGGSTVRQLALCLCAGMIMLLASTRGFAARALTLAELQALVETIPQDPKFPLVANQRVLNRLNGYRTNAGKRKDMKESLARMKQYEALIVPQLEAAGLPFDLLAIPLIESKFKNVKQGRVPKGHKPAAGIWMFITSSGRTNGLVVSKERDDRMSPELSTKAAIKLLKANYELFDDWLLAVQAYNHGEMRVSRAIKTAGSRDAWKLVNAKLLANYLTYVTAGAIILRYPGVIEDPNPSLVVKQAPKPEPDKAKAPATEPTLTVPRIELPYMPDAGG